MSSKISSRARKKNQPAHNVEHGQGNTRVGSTHSRKAPPGKSLNAHSHHIALVDLYIINNDDVALLYDHSIPFVGGFPEEGDLIELAHGRKLLVSGRQWIEEKDGTFRLTVTLTSTLGKIE